MPGGSGGPTPLPTELRRIRSLIRQLQGGTVHILAGWLADDVQSITLGEKPAGTVATAVGIVVTEAFNSSGTDNVRIGGIANVTRFAGDTDVSTTGKKTPTAGTGAQYSAGSDTVTADYVNGGTEPTTGKALVWIEYAFVADAPA